ncbi:DNA-cytosine methyltransferase [Enterobacter hormaechei]|uniref:DNA cytosine methyltransferase n=2 Tax=Enterobacter cloacae complex TaxID=354276 RepID=UPI000792E5BA|nr:DNA cytosine methyltransferase [Enterobacter hormaechei]CZX26277.1 DNA-cytosine methyltransferase [Enterobacter hormaechei]
MFSAIDLFCGGGGLTVGLKQAGYNVLAAVELDSVAAETYKANNHNTTLIERDIRHVSGAEILKSIGLKKGELTLLAGCPPCQSFSTLTRNYSSEDSRNSLIKEVLRLISDIEPQMIMIENVPGMMGRGKPFLKEFMDGIEAQGYIANFGVLQVADYGVPQDRKRFVLLAGKGFEIKIPKATHSLNVNENLKKWITVKEALAGMVKPISLDEANKKGGPKAFNWHVIRKQSDINIERLKYLKPGRPRFDLPDHLRPNCHKGDNSSFSNVYGRMSWDKVSPTITGGCTVLSKGRFGHPEENRTLSVREAARLQTFPDNFIFNTNFIDRVCQIIGNALPCKFAYHMSKACLDSLKMLKE